MTTNRQVIIQELPTDVLTQEHFTYRDAEMPTIGEGEALGRTILMSIDAANRAWMAGATYREAINAGDVMHTYALMEVVESNDPSLKPGDVVSTEGRWAEYVTFKARQALKMPDVQPLSHLMSVYGIAGKTAYHGLINVGQPQAGETVVVSAAAGSVGIYVGQIAKALDCRVVGIAGGPEKCSWVTDELGFDACIDYRGGDLFKGLKQACPKGIDIYFDNVGGDILETVLYQMNLKGRVVCCGAVSQYNTDSPSGPRNVPGMVVVKRLRMEGFIVVDFIKQNKQAIKDLTGWVNDGTIKVVEDIVEGLDNSPQALMGLLDGDNRGKRMVRVGPDPQK